MARILTAAVLIPLVVWVVLGAPYWVFLLVAAIVGVVAYYEFDGMSAAHGLQRTGWPGMAFGALWLAVPDRMALAVLTVAATTLVTLAAMRFKDLSRALSGSAAGV